VLSSIGFLRMKRRKGLSKAADSLGDAADEQISSIQRKQKYIQRMVHEVMTKHPVPLLVP